MGVRLSLLGERRHGSKWQDAIVEAARDMHDLGHGPSEISKILGVNPHTVRSFVYYKHRLGAA